MKKRLMRLSMLIVAFCFVITLSSATKTTIYVPDCLACFIEYTPSSGTYIFEMTGSCLKDNEWCWNNWGCLPDPNGDPDCTSFGCNTMNPTCTAIIH